MEGKSRKNQNIVYDTPKGENLEGNVFSSAISRGRRYQLKPDLNFNIDSMSAEGASGSPGGAHASANADADGSACIRDILLPRDKKKAKLYSYISGREKLRTDCKEKLLIYPNMVEIREINKIKSSRNNRSMGKKEVIKEFSKKSRREFIKFLCKITDKLVLWLDVTFSDDVMEDKESRKDTSNKVLNRFRRIVLKKYPDIKIVYKREWVPRKSGKLQGEYIPHFHMFLSVSGESEQNNLFGLASKLLQTWVECTKTKEIMKALSVALHPKSSRLIVNSKQALKYGSKYISKPAGNWTEESIGRSWGTIGKFNMPKPKITEMTPSEMFLMKRRFRKIVPKRHPIQKALRKKEIPTFLIMREETVNRIIEHTQTMMEQDCFDFFEVKGHEKVDR